MSSPNSTFTATATDADLPAQTLTFALGAGAPAGAGITTGGDFTWTPTEAQGPGVHFPATVTVTDSSHGDSRHRDLHRHRHRSQRRSGARCDRQQSVDELSRADLHGHGDRCRSARPAAHLHHPMPGPARHHRRVVSSPGRPPRPRVPEATRSRSGSAITSAPGLRHRDIHRHRQRSQRRSGARCYRQQSVAELAELTFTATATDGDLPPRP